MPMAASSSKFDMLSGSPDMLTFPNGQRGAYTAASLDRLGSFREGIENRIQSSRPIMPRSGPAFLQGDVTSFLHNLPLDTRLMTAGQKFPRQVGVNRVLTAALGISSEDSQFAPSTSKLISPSLEGIKRFKNGLHDSAMRASDQVKIWGESISKFDKHFPSVWSRKRPRSDVQSSDRLNTSLAGDRLVLGGIASKLAAQSHLTSCGFDYEQQKLEEQTKNGASNKRVRTSMVDVQVDNTLGRPSGVMDREREMFGLANGPIQSEEKDQKLSIVMDGWEKSKLRKKRSGIKSDISASTVLVKPSEGDRESKRDIQQRLGIDARSRLSNIHGFRSGPSSGAVGVGKSDVTSQQTGLGMRLTPKNDSDNGSLLNDRRDRLTGSDKEKLNPKTNNNPLISRLNIHESSSSASPTSTTKMITSARAPRSGSGAIPKSSPSVHRSIGVPDDWEPSQSTNKLHSVVGANNRKRTQSTRSSSPPVVQWAGQRPQKITRVARRTNYVPLLSGNDEGPTTDTLSNVAGNDNGVGLKRSSGIALGQVKLKSDYLSSATLSESEESGAVEIKSKDKGKKSGEIDEKARLNVQKVSNLVLSSRKNKINDEDLGDGVRRQGRTVRGFTSGRPGVTMAVEKLDKAGTAKQLRSARLGSQKVESKPGRPPTRKLSDRKAYTRPRHAVNGGAQDTHEESHNVLEELLAAVKAAVNTGRACSSSLWTQMEPLFGFISAEQITYLKQQINLGYSFFTQTKGAICGSDCSTVTNRFELVECKRDVSIASEAKCVEHFLEQSVSGRRVQNVIPLCQRLIAALVSEENEGFCYNEDEDINFDVYGTRFELDTELKPNILNQQSSGNFQAVGKFSSNGYTVPYTQRYHNGMDHDELDLVAVPNSGMISNLGRPRNGLQANQELTPNMSCTDFQYNQMSMDERVLLEIQSIGIFPEQPDLAQNEDEETGEDIHRLEEKLHQQVAKKKTLLSTLVKSVTEARELQEREIERCAYDKLVLMTFERYMTCWGPNASCGKGASGKVAKQAALASVKQTIDRCQKFEAFRESCFNEPVFQDVFRSVSSHFRAAESLDKITEGESTYLYAGTPTRSSEVRDSVNHVSAQNMDTLDNCYSDGFQSVNHVLEESSKVVTLSNKVKKRELLLDDVAGGTVGTSRAPSGIGSSLLSGAKGKRSERDREGKSHNREMPSRSGTPKIGRPAVGNAKGERKTKTKLKQKTTQLSASVNGLHARASELPKSVPPSVLKSSRTTMDIKTKKKDEFSLDTFNDSEPLDLSHLQIPGIDVLGGPDDLDGQEQDLGSWLNIDDVGFQDDDIMGLEIPMDDLSDLKMML